MNEILNLPGNVNAVGMLLPPRLTFDDWEELGSGLRGCKESIKWWLGDWMNYGENAYGEKYTQALDSTQYDYTYLMNICYVCRKVPHSLRSEKLSFGHHQVVAPLHPDDQQHWLDAAVKKKWTRPELAAAVKKEKEEKGEVKEEPPGNEPPSHTYHCNVMIDTSYNFQVEAKDSKEAENLAMKEALKSLSKNDVVITLVISSPLEIMK